MTRVYFPAPLAVVEPKVKPQGPAPDAPTLVEVVRAAVERREAA